jgi:hypothetical protein
MMDKQKGQGEKNTCKRWEGDKGTKGQKILSWLFNDYLNIMFI